MLDTNEVHSLSEFQKNTGAHIRRLKKTGKTQVLTVNGRAAIVVQNARSYKKLLALVEEAGAVAGIRRGEGIPLEEFDARMRRKHRIPKRK